MRATLPFDVRQAFADSPCRQQIHHPEGGVSAPGSGDMSMRQSCSGGSLTTTIPMRSLPALEIDYSKLTE